MDPGRILLSCGDAKPDGSADVQADAKSHDGSADVQADAVPYHSSAYPSYHAASDSSPAKSSADFSANPFAEDSTSYAPAYLPPNHTSANSESNRRAFAGTDAHSHTIAESLCHGWTFVQSNGGTNIHLNLLTPHLDSLAPIDCLRKRLVYRRHLFMLYIKAILFTKIG